MKIEVKLNKEEQKSRQTEVWKILASTLPPAPRKTLMRLIISGSLLIIALAVFIVVALNNLESNMIVLAVIILIVGVFTLSGSLFDVITKKRKKKKLTEAADAAVDAMFDGIPGAVTAEFDFGEAEASAVYLSASGTTVKKTTVKLTACGATSICDTFAVDFNDTDSYCFTAEEIGKENLLELKRILLAKHESYRDVERDERGKYFLAASE